VSGSVPANLVEIYLPLPGEHGERRLPALGSLFIDASPSLLLR
jgi:hypothetical protein